MEGDLTIHGVTKKIKTKITLVLNEEEYHFNFTLKLRILISKIPSVRSKVSEDVTIAVDFILEGKNDFCKVVDVVFSIFLFESCNHNFFAHTFTTNIG